jgi:RsiW-degrading membrane proteinase PrsW (M82 family)
MTAEYSDEWPSSPTGLAQLGYVILILLGGLMALGGGVYIVLALLFGSAVLDGAVAIAVAMVGVMIAAYAGRGLDAARWQQLVLPSEWVWAVSLALVWLLGILASELLPGGTSRTLPPLIVLGSGLASLWYLTIAARGLQQPVERASLSGAPVPRHIVFLSAGLSASLSIVLALVLEGILLGVVIGIIITVSRLLGDGVTLDVIERLAQDPDVLQRLEELIVQSPAALAGLACILVFIAPAIEETVKALPLFVFARHESKLTERSAILIGVASGVGFAFAENVGYMSMLADTWRLALWFRIGAVVMHGAASGYVGRGWYRGVSQGRWALMLIDCFKGWGLHALWNALALLVGWFAYKELVAGVLFCVLVGMLPLTAFFTLVAKWGIWVSQSEASAEAP